MTKQMNGNSVIQDMDIWFPKYVLLMGNLMILVRARNIKINQLIQLQGQQRLMDFS